MSTPSPWLPQVPQPDPHDPPRAHAAPAPVWVHPAPPPVAPSPGRTAAPGAGYGRAVATGPALGQPLAGRPGVGSPSAAPTHRPAPAPWGLRALALAIDLMVIYAPLVIGFAVHLGTAGPGPGSSPLDEPAPTPLGAAALVTGMVTLVGLWAWTRIVQQGRSGQSIGKKLVRIRLVGLDTGLPVGPGTAFGRDIWHCLVDGVAYIGYLWPLWDRRRQTFADMLCRTVVVRD